MVVLTLSLRYVNVYKARNQLAIGTVTLRPAASIMPGESLANAL